MSLCPSGAHAGPTQGPIGQACVGPERVPRGATLTDSALHGRARAEPTQSPRGQDLGKPPPQLGPMFHTPTSGGGLPKSCPCTATWARPRRARSGPGWAMLTGLAVWVSCFLFPLFESLKTVRSIFVRFFVLLSVLRKMEMTVLQGVFAVL